MMNRRLIWIVLAAFVLPLLVRFIWFFPGFQFPRTVATPDYAAVKMPAAPVSTRPALEIKQESGVVLFDAAHSNQFQPSEVQSLTDAIAQRGGRVEMNSDSSTLAAELKAASAYVVISPVESFTAEEILLIQDFVSRGGRLAVFTDATRGLLSYDYFGNPVGNLPDVNAVNPLLAGFGITINSDYLYNLVENEGNFRNVYLAPFAHSDLNSGLTKVAFYGAHSVETEGGEALLVGNDKTLSSSTDALPSAAGSSSALGWAAAAVNKDQNVLALGDFTFLMPPYDTVADNATLIGHIADFVLDGNRKPTLADYPYLFKGTTVSLLPTSEIQMTADMTGAISRLQSGLASSGTELNIVQEAPSEGDLMVLGTFSPADDLTKYVEPFGITLDSSSEFVKISPFGKFGQQGNGLLLFKAGAKGNTLVLLADTGDDVTTLLDTLGNGNLYGCVLQSDMGLCSIGFGSSFSETTPTVEVTPAAGATVSPLQVPATATPAG